MSRMFPFITTTWNPLGGRCPHRCIYCWSQGEKGLVNRYGMQKYWGEPRLYESEFKPFKPGEFVFVQDMSDLFANDVPSNFIESILNHVEKYPRTKFLLLTKNPSRYLNFILSIPENCVLGATIETNGWTSEKGNFYHSISEAPHPLERIDALRELRDWDVPHQTMVSIEPILDFDLGAFVGYLMDVDPDFVAVGYDNYHHKLPEPPLEKTLRLIRRLERFTKVYRKTVRKAWWE